MCPVRNAELVPQVPLRPSSQEWNALDCRSICSIHPCRAPMKRQHCHLLQLSESPATGAVKQLVVKLCIHGETATVAKCHQHLRAINYVGQPSPLQQ